MNPLMIQAALQLLGSGKLDGILGNFPGLDKLKGLAGDKPITGVDEVASALMVLISKAPVDAEKAKAYSEAVANLVNAALELRAALED